MPLLLVEKESPVRARVWGEHNVPEQLSEQERAKHIMVDKVPKAEKPPEIRRGFDAVRYYNPKTGKLWYEYEARPLTMEEDMEILGEGLAALGDKLDAILAEMQRG